MASTPNTPGNRNATRIGRFCVPIQSAGISTAGTPTGLEIDYRSFAAGELHLGSGIQASTFTWYTSPTSAETGSAGDYLPAYDSAGNAVTQTIGGGSRAYPIPTALAGAAFLRIKSDQDNGEFINVSLKG